MSMKLEMSEQQLTKIFHDGITATFKINLKEHLLAIAKEQIEAIVEASAKELVGKITEYKQFNNHIGEMQIMYSIKLDGIDKGKKNLDEL